MTQPDSHRPTARDVLNEELLVAAFALTVVLPSWDQDIVRRESCKPLPLLVNEVDDLTRELTRYAADL